MRGLKQSGPLASLIASLLIFLAVIGLRNAGYLEFLELSAYDWHIRMRPAPEKPTPRIVLITVTEDDIRELGTWPLPDATLARVVETLVRHRPRAIGIDIYRDVPVPPGGEALEAVLAGNAHIIGVMQFGRGASPGVAPPPALEGTEQIGFSDMMVDPGGVVRRGLLLLDDGQHVAYSLALRLALLYLQAEGVAVQSDPDNPAHIRFGSITIRPFEANDGSYVHADAGGYQFLLDYRHAAPFPAITLTELLAGNFDPALVKDKVVLVGVAAVSVKDIFYTPHSRAHEAARQMAGVALHAHIVGQLLRAGLEGDAPIAVLSDTQEALWILLWSLLGGAVGLMIRSSWRFALATAGGLAVLTLAAHGAFIIGRWVPLVPPAIAWLGSAGLVTAYVSSREKKERTSLMNLFSSHISPQLASAIWEQRDQFLSGGRPRPQRLTATAFFTDVAGFTSVSERLEPPVLMDWLNEYMQVMSPLVGVHGGVILRFIGDAIMAVFGIPVARATEAEIRQDAANAVECALAMQTKLIEHNRSLQQRGLPMIGMRIGILTGPMVAGSMGSAERLEYNVHGDIVNTASRLESFNKEGFVPAHLESPCRILIGQPTLERIGDRYLIERVGEVWLKGKAHATPIYRVLGRQDGGFKGRGDEQPHRGGRCPITRQCCGSQTLTSDKGRLHHLEKGGGT